MNASKDSSRQRAVLVVEDDELCRQSVEALLKSLNLEVIAVDDGESAVAAFQKQGEDIAVVLLDVVLPGLSGAETFRDLRRLKSDLPIVLTSGYDEEVVRKDYSGVEYVGFIAKPCNPITLKEILQRFTME